MFLLGISGVFFSAVRCVHSTDARKWFILSFSFWKSVYDDSLWPIHKFTTTLGHIVAHLNYGEVCSYLLCTEQWGSQGCQLTPRARICIAINWTTMAQKDGGGVNDGRRLEFPPRTGDPSMLYILDDKSPKISDWFIQLISWKNRSMVCKVFSPGRCWPGNANAGRGRCTGIYVKWGRLLARDQRRHPISNFSASYQMIKTRFIVSCCNRVLPS